MFAKLRQLFKSSNVEVETTDDLAQAFLADVVNNQWTRHEPLDDDGLFRIKSEYEQWYRNSPTANGVIPPCTCETCADNRTCTLAFDAYNTDGDCLKNKQWKYMSKFSRDLNIDRVRDSITVDFECKRIVVGIPTTDHVLYSAIKDWWHIHINEVLSQMFPVELISPLHEIHMLHDWILDANLSIFPVNIHGKYYDGNTMLYEVIERLRDN